MKSIVILLIAGLLTAACTKKGEKHMDVATTDITAHIGSLEDYQALVKQEEELRAKANAQPETEVKPLLKQLFKLNAVWAIQLPNLVKEKETLLEGALKNWSDREVAGQTLSAAAGQKAETLEKAQAKTQEVSESIFTLLKTSEGIEALAALTTDLTKELSEGAAALQVKVAAHQTEPNEELEKQILDEQAKLNEAHMIYQSVQAFQNENAAKLAEMTQVADAN